MSATEPMTAPARLIARVNEEVWKRGLTRRPARAKVTPFPRTQTMPNPWIPRGSEVWIARCPECPGAEVVPAEGPFVCGSCGAEAEVDWSEA